MKKILTNGNGLWQKGAGMHENVQNDLQTACLVVVKLLIAYANDYRPTYILSNNVNDLSVKNALSVSISLSLSSTELFQINKLSKLFLYYYLSGDLFPYVLPFL